MKKILKKFRQKLRKKLAKKDYIVSIYRTLRAIKQVKFNFINFLQFLKDYRTYRNQLLKKSNNNQEISFRYLFPVLTEKFSEIRIEPIYFYQDAWCAKKIFQNKPQCHYDIGSNIKLISIISQFCPVTYVELRDVELKLENLNVVIADIRNLPFEDDSI